LQDENLSTDTDKTRICEVYEAVRDKTGGLMIKEIEKGLLKIKGVKPDYVTDKAFGKFEARMVISLSPSFFSRFPCIYNRSCHPEERRIPYLTILNRRASTIRLDG